MPEDTINRPDNSPLPGRGKGYRGCTHNPAHQCLMCLRAMNAARQRRLRRTNVKVQAYRKRYRNKKYREIRQYLNDLKSVPCMDCKQTWPPYVMEFDHRPGEQKRFNVGNAPGGNSFETVQAEIAKCDLVCANCHRIRTHTRPKEVRNGTFD